MSLYPLSLFSLLVFVAGIAISLIKVNCTANSNGHIVLLGDSIFENSHYVQGDTDVINHVRNKIEKDNLIYKSTILAIDGHTIGQLERYQVDKIPSDASHLFISIGGNNALQSQSILTKSCRNVGEALYLLSAFRSQFQEEYRSMLNSVMKKAKESDAKVSLCTIYYPRWEDQTRLSVAKLALDSLNDVIIQEAIDRKLPIIDLKTIFNEYDDYSNSIEPSSKGGEKISQVILSVVTSHDFKEPKATIYTL